MIVFDLDKTLRDTTGSSKYAPKNVGGIPDWSEWQEWVNKNGKPIEPMMKLLHKFSGSRFVEVLILTSSQYGTEGWLIANGCFIENIIEREDDDYRHRYVYKTAFINEHHGEIELWVDDCRLCCEYASFLGIPVIHVTDKIRRGY